MKKVTILSLTVVTVAFAAIWVFNSCGKQDAGDTLKLGNPVMSDEDVKINNLIKSFRAKMDYFRDHPEYKSGEVMGVDSAVWYIDALFNFTYAYTDQSFTSFKTDTFNIMVNKNNGLVDFSELNVAYTSLKEQTLMVFDETEGDDKELYVSYMNIEHDNDEEVIFKTTVTIGAKGIDTPPPGASEWGPFVMGDNWMYGELLGDCTPYGGNWNGLKDAATEIQDATNTYRYKYITDSGLGWYAYYTDPSAVVTVTVYGDPTYKDLLLNNYDDIIDNYRDYIILYKENYPPNMVIETCIPWEDMNYYYHGTHKLIYQIVQENSNEFGIPANLTFTNCTMAGIGIGGNPENPNYAYHEVLISYKTRHIGITGDERSSLNDLLL